LIVDAGSGARGILLGLIKTAGTIRKIPGIPSRSAAQALNTCTVYHDHLRVNPASAAPIAARIADYPGFPDHVRPELIAATVGLKQFLYRVNYGGRILKMLEAIE
jgi:hypothetical protein